MEKLSISNEGRADSVFDYSAEYLYQDELYGIEGRPAAAELFGGGGGNSDALPSTSFGENDDDDQIELQNHYGPQWAVVQFDEPVTAPSNCLVIGARLDADLQTSTCRIALSGHIQSIFDHPTKNSTTTTTTKHTATPKPTKTSSLLLLHQLKVYKLKQRVGTVERFESDGCTAICRGMFSKESDLTQFIGMTVKSATRSSTNTSSTSDTNTVKRGVLEGSFGKSGKFRVRFTEPLGKNNSTSSTSAGGGIVVVLEYKRFIFDPDKRRIAQ
jgi:selenocysteine-specific elongation factor